MRDRVDERISARDGSYVGGRSPSIAASVHAVLHGRVVFQFRPDVPAAEIAPLDRLVRRSPSRTLLCANRCAGTRFDPEIVALFEDVMRARALSPTADAVPSP